MIPVKRANPIDIKNANGTLALTNTKAVIVTTVDNDIVSILLVGVYDIQ
jgi:hypothetical protein